MRVQKRYYVGAAALRGLTLVQAFLVAPAVLSPETPWFGKAILVFVTMIGVAVYGGFEHAVMADGRKARRKKIHSEMREKRYHERLERQRRDDFL